MFEMHNLQQQIEFLKSITTKENKELIEEIIHDLSYPLQTFCLQEAEFRLTEALEQESSEEHVCWLADRFYEENENWIDSDWLAKMTDKIQKYMNTEFNYLYRDASNYKKYNSFVLEGIMSKKDYEKIRQCLQDGIWFIPRRVGLPEDRFFPLTEEDHEYFEFVSLELTDKPAGYMSVEELVHNFQDVYGKLEEKR